MTDPQDRPRFLAELADALISRCPTCGGWMWLGKCKVKHPKRGK